MRAFLSNGITEGTRWVHRAGYGSDAACIAGMGAWALDEATRILAETEPKSHALLDDDTPVHKPWIFTFGTAHAREALAEALAAFVSEGGAQ